MWKKVILLLTLQSMSIKAGNIHRSNGKCRYQERALSATAEYQGFYFEHKDKKT
jgi:hypothetical protein